MLQPVNFEKYSVEAVADNLGRRPTENELVWVHLLAAALTDQTPTTDETEMMSLDRFTSSVSSWLERRLLQHGNGTTIRRHFVGGDVVLAAARLAGFDTGVLPAITKYHPPEPDWVKLPIKNKGEHVVVRAGAAWIAVRPFGSDAIRMDILDADMERLILPILESTECKLISADDLPDTR